MDDVLRRNETAKDMRPKATNFEMSNRNVGTAVDEMTAGHIGDGTYNRYQSLGINNRLDIFIYESMDRSGGIQSIVHREINRAVDLDHPAVIISKSFDIPNYSRSIRRLDFYKKPIALAREISDLTIDNGWRVNLVALSPEAAPVAFLLQWLLTKNPHVADARMCVTILHPRDFMRETEKKHVHLLNKIAAHAVGITNLVFMNEQCRSTHAKQFGMDLSQNRIVPVPIDARQLGWRGPNPDGTLKIIAVGRIVDFKAYNFSLPKVVAKLSAKGHKVTCDIFGYGTGEIKLKSIIEENGVGHLVKFHGPTSFESLDDLISDYDVFVGMGTAAVQAAQLGVPTILAIVDDADGTHGFIHEAPFGNLGEQDERIYRHDLEETIESYLNLSEAERRRLSDQGAKYANRYVSDDYVEKLTQHIDSTQVTSHYWSILYCKFYLWMAKDNWLRVLVRGVKRLVRPEPQS
jgi:hypothetical protein